MRAESDPALETLMLPLAEGRLAWPGDGALFLRARDGWPLHAAPRPGLVAEQSFRPDAQALEASGIALATPGDTRLYPLVMLLPPRQRDESRALMARAIASLAPGGRTLGRAGPGGDRRPAGYHQQAQVPGVLDRAAGRPGRRHVGRALVGAGRGAHHR